MPSVSRFMLVTLVLAILLAALLVFAARGAQAAPRLPTCTAEQAKTAVIREETIVPGVVRRTHKAGCYTMTKHPGARPSQSAPKKVRK